MFEFIEKVVYINLEHRVDRKEETEAELFRYFPKEKVIRFNAIRDSKGSVGCSKSHIGALELAKEQGWKNVLIVEDDASWDERFEAEYSVLETLVSAPYDVICLGLLGYVDKVTRRVSLGQTRTAYLVAQHYYDALIENMKEGLGHLSTHEYTAENRDKYCGDQYWKLLQEKDKWFRVWMMIQRKSFSDICKQVVDYGYLFQKF